MAKVIKDDYSVAVVFSVKDNVEGKFAMPLSYFGPHAEERVRDLFTRAVSEICAETHGARKVSDYDLYRVGTFYAKTGVLVSEPNGPALLV